MEDIEVSTSNIVTGPESIIQQTVLKEIPFTGQGFYMMERKTVLIVPHQQLQSSPATLFRAHIYNVPWEKTIFFQITDDSVGDPFPTRFDSEEEPAKAQ